MIGGPLCHCRIASDGNSNMITFSVRLSRMCRPTMTSLSLSTIAPSLDGTYVAYGLSQGGSENSVLHVMETATGRILPDAIDRTQYASPSWLPDGKSFFYWRSNKVPEGAPPTEIYKRMRTYLHILGNSDPDKDRAVFGYGITPDVTEDHFTFVGYTPGSPYLIAVGGHGVKPEQMMFTAPVTALSKNPIPWKRIISEDDDVVNATIRGNDIYLHAVLGLIMAGIGFTAKPEAAAITP